MGTWILFVWINFTYPVPRAAITVQEFSTKYKCEFAVEYLKRRDSGIQAMCFPK